MCSAHCRIGFNILGNYREYTPNKPEGGGESCRSFIIGVFQILSVHFEEKISKKKKNVKVKKKVSDLGVMLYRTKALYLNLEKKIPNPNQNLQLRPAQ